MRTYYKWQETEFDLSHLMTLLIGFLLSSSIIGFYYNFLLFLISFILLIILGILCVSKIKLLKNGM